jgi:ParB family transcriptional regulator, chromosome partitioning protein
MASEVTSVLPSALTDTGQTVLVPLSNLFRDPLNVRKTGGQDVESLAALIATHGLLQNLVVRVEFKRNKATGRRGVVAGGRRLRALELLWTRGQLPTDHPVRCRLVSQEQALAVSLAENSGREALHGADLFDAFVAMEEQGRSAQQIADSWGVSLLTVERRLKLGMLSPELLGLYRQDGISLDELEALALLDDPSQQMAVWHSLPAQYRDAREIRRVITKDQFSMTHPWVGFVGLDTYMAAGGDVTRDLFSEEGDGGTITDSALLRQLALDALKTQAGALVGSGCAWFDVRLECQPHALTVYGGEFERCRLVSREPTASEARKTKAYARLLTWMENRMDTVDDDNADDNADDNMDDTDGLEDAHAERGREADALRSSLRVPAQADAALAGAVVYLDRNGKPAVVSGLIRPTDRKNLSTEDGDDDATGALKAGSANGIKATRSEYPERLMRQLTTHRTAALQACLMDAPAVGLRVLAYRMAGLIFLRHGFYGVGDEPVEVRLSMTDLDKDAPDCADSLAGAQIARTHRAWAERLPSDAAALLAWLLAADDATVIALLAYCTARTVNTVQSKPNATPVADAISAAVALDMADWWVPTCASYLSAVPKNKIIEVVTQARSAGEAQAMTAMKKDELAAAAERALAGSRWLPSPLRLAA